MNKRVLSFAFAIVATLVANGQASSRISTVAVNGLQSLVRQDTATGNHVTCSHPKASEVHFALADASRMLDVKVAEHIRVTDFEIIDNKVFFCGDDYVVGSGLLGWFDIDSLFYHNAPVHIDATLSTLGLATLDDIEVFHGTSSGEIHVAGYGHRATAGKADLLFEAKGHPYTGMTYRTMQVESARLVPDIVDMAVTDSYVVYLSQVMYDDPKHLGTGATLYPFPKYAMFDTPPFTSDYFQFAAVGYYPDLVMYRTNIDPVSSPRIVHYADDKVTVCSHNITNNISDSGYVRRVSGELSFRTFDLAPLASGDPIRMTSAHYVGLPNCFLGDIVDLHYDYDLAQYLVLHRHKAMSGHMEYGVTHINCSGGVFPLSVLSEYTQYINTYADWHPYGICLDNGAGFTVVGWHIGAPHNYVFWQGDVAIVGPNCVSQYQYPTTPIQIEESKRELYYGSLLGWNALEFLRKVGHPICQYLTNIMCE